VLKFIRKPADTGKSKYHVIKVLAGSKDDDNYDRNYDYAAEHPLVVALL
jgi:hypothetical protein